MKKTPPKEAAIDYLRDLVRDCSADDKDRLKAAEIILKASPQEVTDNKIEVVIRTV